MKIISSLFIISTFCSVFSVSANNIILSVDKDRIVDLTNKYIVLMQKTINQRLKEFYTEIDICFNDPIINYHTYDLSNKIEKEFIAAYLFDAYNDTGIIEFNANTEDIEILPCTYFNPTTGKQYTYVKIPKILIRTGNKKAVYKHYLSINISDPQHYFIEEVYNDDAVTQQMYIAPCMNEHLDAEKQKELAQTIALKYEKVTQLYSQKNYLEALVIIEDILSINPNHQESLDAKEAVFDLVDYYDLNIKINKALSGNNLDEANRTLSLAKKYSLANSSEILQWEKLIGNKELRIKQELKFQEAENFFNNEMYQQALSIYTKLSSEGANIPNLQNRITFCQDQDPELIQKRIQKAYNEAVASRKNYESTFKTYYKYENSGYLKGTNYQFMCLMMIDKDNKKLLRSLGMSGNQAKNLAIKYFYKAREMGINTRDIEILVFTKNFNKLRKN